MAQTRHPLIVIAAGAALFVCQPVLAQEDLQQVVTLDPISLRALDADGSAADRQVAGIVPLLAIERKAVGVFRDGNMCQQRLGRHVAVDDMRRGQGLNNAIPSLERVIGPG